MRLLYDTTAIALCIFTALMFICGAAYRIDFGHYGRVDLIRDALLLVLICIHIWRGRGE